MRKIDTYKVSLLDRTKFFAVKIIHLSSNLPKNPAGFTIADQLVRAGTSIGANFVEAQEATSRKDFFYKVNYSLKEAKETNYWLELILESELVPKLEIQPLLQESGEIVKILVTIVKKLKMKA